MESITKQAYEEFMVAVSFGANFASGEAITVCSATATDRSGTDATATVTDQTTLTNGVWAVSVKVKAGTEANSPYKLTFRCTTSAGHKWEHDIQMKVEEI